MRYFVLVATVLLLWLSLGGTAEAQQRKEFCTKEHQTFVTAVHRHQAAFKKHKPDHPEVVSTADTAGSLYGVFANCLRAANEVAQRNWLGSPSRLQAEAQPQR